MLMPTTTEAAKSDLKQHKEAIADYDKAIELNPKYFNAYYNRGTAKDGLNNTKKLLQITTKP